MADGARQRASGPETHLVVNRQVRIPLTEIEVRFSASGGPGGQHANKAATRVELTLDVAGSPSIPERQRDRIVAKLGPTVRVVVDEHRSQTRNRVLAHERLRARLASALHVEAPRRATKPSRGSKERRLKAKKQRSDTKANRRRPTAGDH